MLQKNEKLLIFIKDIVMSIFAIVSFLFFTTAVVHFTNDLNIFFISFSLIFFSPFDDASVQVTYILQLPSILINCSYLLNLLTIVKL